MCIVKGMDVRMIKTYKNMPRVLLISPLPPPPGGDSIWALRYMSYSKKHTLPIEIVNTAVIGKRAENVDDSKSIIEEIRRCFKIWSNIKKKIVDFNPQVIHMNTNCSPKGIIRDYISARIINSKRIPMIIHCRCNIEDQLGNSTIGKYFLKKIAELSKLVIVLNTSSEKYMNQVSKTKTKIVANFVNDDFIMSEHRQINKEMKQILFVGHVKRTKGVSEIIEAAREFPELRFVIAGPITEEFSDFKTNSNVKLIGSQSIDKIKNLLLESDLFLFPTYTEGFSNALLEAMATGIPIITTNVGANESMIENKGGIIINKQTYEEISRAINVLESQEVRIEMSKWNIKKVKENYTIQKVVDELNDIYCKVRI